MSCITASCYFLIFLANSSSGLSEPDCRQLYWCSINKDSSNFVKHFFHIIFCRVLQWNLWCSRRLWWTPWYSFLSSGFLSSRKKTLSNHSSTQSLTNILIQFKFNVNHVSFLLVLPGFYRESAYKPRSELSAQSQSQDPPYPFAPLEVECLMFISKGKIRNGSFLSVSLVLAVKSQDFGAVALPRQWKRHFVDFTSGNSLTWCQREY